MNDKVVSLFPDSPLAPIDNSVDMIASNLEELAAQVRNGERTVRYGVFSYVNNTHHVVVHSVGDQTRHLQVALTSLASHIVMKDLCEPAES